MTSLLKLSVTAILFGAIFIVGINAISDAPAYTTHTETFNTSVPPATIQLSKTGLVSGTVVVSNSSYGVILAASNYTVNNAAGTITTVLPNFMNNNSIYTISFGSGQQSSTINTMVIVVMALIVGVLGLLMILREAGIDVLKGLK